MNVSGLSVKDIMNMDWAEIKKLNRADMAQLTSRLASAGNKRLRRLEKAGLQYTPAYDFISRSGGDFSVKGKDLKQIQKEFNRVRIFLDEHKKTNTVKGAKQWTKQISENFNVGEGEVKELSEWQKKSLYKAFRQYKEAFKAVVENEGSDTIIQNIREIQSKDARYGGDKLFEFFRNTELSEEYYFRSIGRNDTDDFYDLPPTDKSGELPQVQ